MIEDEKIDFFELLIHRMNIDQTNKVQDFERYSIMKPFNVKFK